VYLEADAPRVCCAEHGVVVAAVPWARHGARFTTGFEDTAAWLACHAALSVLSVLLGDYLAVGVGDRGPGGR